MAVDSDVVFFSGRKKNDGEGCVMSKQGKAKQRWVSWVNSDR